MKIQTIRLLRFTCSLAFVLAVSTLAAQRKFAPHQVITKADGEKIEVLNCRGEGDSMMCDVIYYRETRQSGKRMWQSAKVLMQEKTAARKQASVVTTPLVKDTAPPRQTLPVRQVPKKRVTPPVKTPRKDSARIVSGYIIPKPLVRKPKQVNNGSPQPKQPTIAPRKDIVTQEEYVTIIDSTVTIVSEVQKGTAPAIDTPKAVSPASQSHTDTLNNKKLSVFIDCSNASCDYDYIRTEINIVDFFSDPLAADVHVLITEQKNGSGGSAYQLIFYGQNGFKNRRDTITLNVDPNATDYEKRAELTRGIKLGLVSFLMKTPYAYLLDVKLQPASQKSQQVLPTKDKWNYWVFRLQGDGSFDADEVYKTSRWGGSFSANRTTDKIKWSFTAAADYNQTVYDYDDNGTTLQYKVLNTGYSFQHTLIKSLGKHWGIGYEGELTNSTFSNNRRRIYAMAAIEYSFFPYKDVNNRLFTISYGADFRSNRYYDSTIYFKIEEQLYGQVAQIALSLNQKWGTISSRFSYRSYFKDLQLDNLNANITMNVRISGGLSFYLYGSASRVRDQVYLVKGKATEQDVFTRRRQLASEYTLFSGAGLSFRFGSKLNNFVNPRMSFF